MGAPLGNHNARKHEPPSSPAGRMARAALDLTVEINGLRFLYSRIVQSSLAVTDLPTLLDAARVLNYLSNSITRLARLQFTVSPPAQADEAAEIARFTAELRRDRGVREIEGPPEPDPEPEEDAAPPVPFDPALHYPIFRPYPDPQPSQSHQTLTVSETVRVFDHGAQTGLPPAPLAGGKPPALRGASPRQEIIPRTDESIVSIDFLNQNKPRLDPPQSFLHESRFTPHESLLLKQNNPSISSPQPPSGDASPSGDESPSGGLIPLAEGASPRQGIIPRIDESIVSIDFLNQNKPPP